MSTKRDGAYAIILEKIISCLTFLLVRLKNFGNHLIVWVCQITTKTFRFPSNNDMMVHVCQMVTKFFFGDWKISSHVLSLFLFLYFFLSPYFYCHFMPFPLCFLKIRSPLENEGVSDGNQKNSIAIQHTFTVGCQLKNFNRHLTHTYH
jgi:hypothetical protein